MFLQVSQKLSNSQKSLYIRDVGILNSTGRDPLLCATIACQNCGRILLAFAFVGLPGCKTEKDVLRDTEETKMLNSQC